MLRAIRAEKSVGRASASSRALVCSDWVWPWVAAIASTQVRVTLLKTSCAVSDQPEVCEWVRSDSDLGFFGSNCLTSLAHSSRAARSLAISMKKFMPIAQKKDSRGAKASTSRPASMPGAQVLHPVGEGVGQLQVGRRPGLLDVVAGDGDGVVARHLLRGVGEDVGDDPHRGLRRIDVGVADHELLEDVVLDGPGQLLGRHALLLGGHDVEREHGQHGAVHRHRHASSCPAGCRRRAAACRRSSRSPRPPCRRRRSPAGGRCRSRGGWAGRRRPTGPSGRRPGCAGRRRWTPRRWRSRRTAGSSRAG